MKFDPKSAWGPGPWQDEPDWLEWIDERTRLACRIIRNMHFGNLCGYVGVPPAHPYFGWGYDDNIKLKPEDIEGLRIGDDVGYFETFVYAMQGGTEHGTIPLGFTLRAHCGVNFSGEHHDDSEALWWFGFDCGHCDDLSPGLESRSHLFTQLVARVVPPELQERMMETAANRKYRDIDYVRREVTALAFQLRQLETRVLIDAGVLKFIKGPTQ